MADSSKYVVLQSGDKFPIVGLGTWKIENKDSEKCVYEAIKLGYRHIDCAPLYGNEKEVGLGIQRAISEGICTRQDLWITSKLWNTNHKYEHVLPALTRTLNDLKLEYLDLFLMHFPTSLRYVDPSIRYPADWIYNTETSTMELSDVPLNETWSAMESIYDKGLAKNIGISNFNCQLTQDLIKYARVKPAVNQIEFHPYLVQTNLIKYCAKVGIAITAYSPFGGIGYIEIGISSSNEPQVLEEAIVKKISDAHNKSPAQVILRWCIQCGELMTVIAKSSKVERLKHNLDVMNFQLTDEEMASISSLHKNRRYNDPGFYCGTFFNNFFPLFD